MFLYPNDIKPDSWLNDPKYKWFIDGYLYAMTQNKAIPTLFMMEPEDLYFAVVAIMRGANIPIPDEKPL